MSRTKLMSSAKDTTTALGIGAKELAHLHQPNLFELRARQIGEGCGGEPLGNFRAQQANVLQWKDGLTRNRLSRQLASYRHETAMNFPVKHHVFRVLTETDADNALSQLDDIVISCLVLLDVSIFILETSICLSSIALGGCCTVQKWRSLPLKATDRCWS
ncbi:MAG: hypothetical protein AAFX40_01585 [Cyanobacteria bacterium J06639_1]